MTPLMEGVKGGVRTIISEVGHPHAVTFSTRRGMVLIITPSGELQPGPALGKDAVTSETGDMLVECFGRAYRSALYRAEARAKGAEAESKRLQHKLDATESMLKIVEAKLAKAQQ